MCSAKNIRFPFECRVIPLNCICNCTPEGIILTRTSVNRRLFIHQSCCLWNSRPKYFETALLSGGLVGPFGKFKHGGFRPVYLDQFPCSSKQPFSHTVSNNINGGNSGTTQGRSLAVPRHPIIETQTNQISTGRGGSETISDIAKDRIAGSLTGRDKLPDKDERNAEETTATQDALS